MPLLFFSATNKGPLGLNAYQIIRIYYVPFLYFTLLVVTEGIIMDRLLPKK